MKYFWILPVAFAVLFLAFAATGILSTTEDLRTDLVDETFNAVTAVGASNATVQLSSSLWQSSLAFASITSNDTSDSPILYSYNATSRAVLITGLAGNVTRELKVSYKISGLGDYPGSEDAATKIPTIVLALIVLVGLTAMIAAVVLAINYIKEHR